MEKRIQKQSSQSSSSDSSSKLCFKQQRQRYQSKTKTQPCNKKSVKKGIEDQFRILDEKIDQLRKDIYQDPLPTKHYQPSHSKIIEVCKSKKKAPLFPKEPYYSKDVRTVTFLKNKSKENTILVDQFIKALKNEVYEKADTDEQDMSINRQLYAQWILQVLIDRVPKQYLMTGGIKSFASPLVQKLFIVRDIMRNCNECTSDSFQEMIEFLDNNGIKRLSKIETDYLIYLHIKARIVALFELKKVAKYKYVDIVKHESIYGISSKAHDLELQKMYLEVLFKLKNLLEEMQKLSVIDTLFAFTKSGSTNLEAKEMMAAYDNFCNYLKGVSGESTDIKGMKYTKTISKKHKHLNDKVIQLFKTLDNKLHECEEYGDHEIAENFTVTMVYSEFKIEKVGLLKALREIVYKMKNLGINDVSSVRSQLISMKKHILTVLDKYWIFEKELLKYNHNKNYSEADDKENNEQYYVTGMINILNQRFEETKHQIQMMDEVEFSPSFILMTKLCELLDKKNRLIDRFKNFLIRIQHQTISDIPYIKKCLSEFDKESYKLSSEYYKYKAHLELLTIDDSTIQNESFNKYEEMADLHKESAKKKIELPRLRRVVAEGILDVYRESSSVAARLVKFHEPVKETKFHLYRLDEVVNSKSFPAMALLCDLHREKEEIISCFKNLVQKAKYLNIHDEEKIVTRLNELNFEAEEQTNKYTNLGMLMLSFSELMAIINEKAIASQMTKPDKETQSEKRDYLQMVGIQTSNSETGNENDTNTNPSITISDLFGGTKQLRWHHADLDRAIGNQWFPSREHLSELRKERKKMTFQFQNLLDRTADLDCDNLMPFMYRLRELIREAEIVMHKLQSLRYQVMWLGGATTLLREKKEYKHEDLAERVRFVINEKIRRFEDIITNPDIAS